MSKLICFFIFKFSKATVHKHILGNKLHLPDTWLENKWLLIFYILKGKSKFQAWKDRHDIGSWICSPTQTDRPQSLPFGSTMTEPMLGTHGSWWDDKNDSYFRHDAKRTALQCVTFLKAVLNFLSLIFIFPSLSHLILSCKIFFWLNSGLIFTEIWEYSREVSWFS